MIASRVKNNYLTIVKERDVMRTGRPRGFDKERALAIAMDMFWRKGFAATSMADLCSTLSIAPPSLYAAFGSKERLYEECISYYMANVAPRIWDRFQKAATARDAVQAFLRDSAEVLPGINKPSGCMVTLSDVRGEGSEHLGQFVEAARRQGLLLVERKLEEAIATGELKSDVSPSVVARYFLSVQQGMSIQARDGATVDELREVADTAMKAWPAPS
ncbi:TetR/AcrR family transcriptional regulator [Ensifer sp. ENS11]|uniref:TetR/AcrR family transcriptional regulator n=1 Tax=Ensifer sp. ENS11 TaxID=2769291 RepID=UPI001FEDB034|nr:TetR/AcrR family transcriptional regulator [Ensifer sp. ENS11]